MLRSERENEILRLLEECQYATVTHLAQHLHISASSIRRDLSVLESRGLLRRSYGGAELVTSATRMIPFSMRSDQHYAEKKRIARCAASLVHSGDVLYLDGSTTSYSMIDHLAAIKNLTVATNSIDSLCALAPYDIRAFCTGGHISRENRAVLTGHLASQMIAGLRADYVFFSAQAVWEDGSIFDCYESEVPLRQQMLRSARTSVLLCDSSKFFQSSLFFVEHLRHIDYVITDAALPTAFTAQFPDTTFLIAE